MIKTEHAELETLLRRFCRDEEALAREWFKGREVLGVWAVLAEFTRWTYAGFAHAYPAGLPRNQGLTAGLIVRKGLVPALACLNWHARWDGFQGCTLSQQDRFAAYRLCAAFGHTTHLLRILQIVENGEGVVYSDGGDFSLEVNGHPGRDVEDWASYQREKPISEFLCAEEFEASVYFYIKHSRNRYECSPTLAALLKRYLSNLALYWGRIHHESRMFAIPATYGGVNASTWKLLCDVQMARSLIELHETTFRFGTGPSSFFNAELALVPREDDCELSLLRSLGIGDASTDMLDAQTVMIPRGQEIWENIKPQDVPLPRYFSNGSGMRISCFAGPLLNGYTAVHEHLRLRHKRDWAEAKKNNSYEKVQREELSAALRGVGVVVTRGLKISGKFETDIDAVAVSEHGIALVQLKWQESFSLSVATYRKRSQNLTCEANDWIVRVRGWLEEDGKNSLVNFLRNQGCSVPDVPPTLWVVSAGRAKFSDSHGSRGPAAWTSFDELCCAVERHSTGDFIENLPKYLRELELEALDSSGNIGSQPEEYRIAGRSVRVRRNFSRSA